MQQLTSSVASLSNNEESTLQSFPNQADAGQNQIQRANARWNQIGANVRDYRIPNPSPTPVVSISRRQELNDALRAHQMNNVRRTPVRAVRQNQASGGPGRLQTRRVSAFQ